jgi:hypothetical protein
LTDEAIARASVRHATDAPLTKEERLALEEVQHMPTGPVGGAMASAMSAVPFKCSSKVVKALSGFASGQANFVVVSVSEKEKIELDCIKTLASEDAISEQLSPTEPRYVVLRRAVGGSGEWLTFWMDIWIVLCGCGQGGSHVCVVWSGGYVRVCACMFVFVPQLRCVAFVWYCSVFDRWIGRS